MRISDNADPNQKLIWNLLDIEHVMHRLYEGRGSQKQILIILNETGVMTQSELTQRLGIQPGSASEVLGKLESAGLISRTTSETDRRTTDIALTPAGQEQADAATQMRRQRHSDMFACLTEDERARLLELLEKINADWSQRYRDAEPHGGEHHGPHHGRRHEHFGRHK
ncbi:MAG: MarR family winged helix-turn-helix transcriptional regulator [Candidatus Fimadaptatus sp.]